MTDPAQTPQILAIPDDRPLILVTNDDGVTAPGIAALAAALEAIGTVVVVAPDLNRSGESHKISLLDPIRLKQHRPGWWSTNGTPTDCVYLAVIEMLPRRPDLVVSGINAGPNLSHDVHYSGTVAAAVEGTLFEISSIAVSLVDVAHGSYALAAEFTKNLAARVLAMGGLPIGTTLNVNVPGGAPTRHQMTYLGHRSYRHSIHKRVDPRGGVYYWIGGMPDQPRDLEGSDCNAVGRGVISVTPLTIDMTNNRALARGLDRLEVAGSLLEPANPPSDELGYDPAAEK
ncbi:5'/3'-nucleotidase SurE [Myxococcota bacterium]|nr:5'/3'-nucleotidase SurE [Myxococcota bacterium]